MTESIRALLSEIIDYAGIFPPARLPLDAAARAYRDALRGPHAWMVGRFICPAARLGELAGLHRELDPDGRPWRVSALGRGGDTAAGFVEGVRADAALVTDFAAGRLPHPKSGRPNDPADANRLTVDVFEARAALDAAARDGRAALRSAVERATASLAKTWPGVTPYYELSLTGDWRANVEALIAAVPGPNAKGGPRGGVKLRTGGLEAAAFPSPEQVAFVMDRCRSAGVAWKATAGLHHPYRHHNDAVGAKMHGFLNVFGAACLIHARAGDAARVAAVLDDGSPGAFRFDDEGMTIGGTRVELCAIAECRRAFAVSFGSCSVDEPIADLTAGGLI